MTVDQFITYLETTPELKLDLHVRAQTDLIPVGWDTLDFVGRMENLNEHLKYAIRKCLPHVDSSNISTPHLNISKHRVGIDEDDLDRIHVYVMNEYKEDIRLLGYSEKTKEMTDPAYRHL